VEQNDRHVSVYPAGSGMTASYGAGSVFRMPIEPKTIGDHIRKRRLSLQMLQ
jgi:hypothetical protein